MDGVVGDLGAVLVTWERPQVAGEYLKVLRTQCSLPANLVVVDNSASSSTDLAVRVGALGSERGVDATYIHSRVNLGPAGGFNAGVDMLGGTTAEAVVLLDDDDPPSHAEAISVIYELFRQQRAADPRTAGVGFRGATFSPRSALASASKADGAVDHLHGGYLPVYDMRAFRDVAGFDPHVFWGFEELDLGRRLVLDGYRLWAANSLIDTYTPSPKVAERSVANALRARPESSSRYLKTRNLAHIVRRESPVVGTGVLASRSVVRAIVTDLVQRRSFELTRATLAGLRDGLELGVSFEASFVDLVERASGD